MYSRAFALLLIFVPIVATASLDVSTLVTCSGDLSLSTGINLPSSVLCSGDLSFSGASLTSDTPLSIISGNDLSFYGVSVFAPSLNFQSGGSLTIDPQSVLNSADVNFLFGSILSMNDFYSYNTSVSTPSLNIQAGGIPILSSANITLSPDSISFNEQLNPVPEPSSLCLLFVGLVIAISTFTCSRKSGLQTNVFS